MHLSESTIFDLRNTIPGSYSKETNNDTTKMKTSLQPPEAIERTMDNKSPVGLTNDDIINILHAENYVVRNFSDGGPPLVVVGDVAYYPESLVPEIEQSSVHRTTNIQNKKLWIDTAGRQQSWYYYDTQTRADHTIFKEAVGTWARSTCIQFNKMAPGGCQEDRGHGAICVGDFGGCFSLVGNNYSNGWSRKSQRMSVQPRGCEMVAAAHEFGHALGLQHEQSRADVTEFMYVNYYNLDIKLQGSLDQNTKQAWFQASRCSRDQTLNLPIPYDYLSIMQYGASDFAAEDARIVYSVKDAHYQYMLDYHRNSGVAQTHYDKLVVNMAYKCTDLWRNHCETNGRSAPKCKNNGYIDKDCKCACPPGFSGYACGSKDGPLYPVQDRAKTMIDVKEPTQLDLTGKGMHLENHNYVLKTFVYWQFITVCIDAGAERLRPTVDVHQPFDRVQQFLQPMRNQDFFMTNIKISDCETSLFFYWGNSHANKLRTECISSLVNNEFQEYRPQLRSFNHTLDMVGVSFMGKMMNVPDLSMHIMELQLDIKFEVNPRLQLRNFKSPEDDPGPLSDPKTGRKPGSLPVCAIVGIVIGVVLLLVLVGLLVAWKMGKLCK